MIYYLLGDFRILFHKLQPKSIQMIRGKKKTKIIETPFCVF